jgi:hypothetical protein
MFCLRVCLGDRKQINHIIFWYESHTKTPLAITNRERFKKIKWAATQASQEILSWNVVFSVESKAGFFNNSWAGWGKEPDLETSAKASCYVSKMALFWQPPFFRDLVPVLFWGRSILWFIGNFLDPYKSQRLCECMWNEKGMVVGIIKELWSVCDILQQGPFLLFLRHSFPPVPCTPQSCIHCRKW